MWISTQRTVDGRKQNKRIFRCPLTTTDVSPSLLGAQSPEQAQGQDLPTGNQGTQGEGAESWLFDWMLIIQIPTFPPRQKIVIGLRGPRCKQVTNQRTRGSFTCVLLCVSDCCIPTHTGGSLKTKTHPSLTSVSLHSRSDGVLRSVAPQWCLLSG